MKSFANKLTILRTSNKLTKKQVADAVGVHPSSIGNLEKGSIPQADLLYLLAKYFNVTMESLIDTNIEYPIKSSSYDDIPAKPLEYMDLFIQLSLEDQDEILEIIKLKLSRSKRKSNPKTKSQFSNNLEGTSIIA